MPSLESRLCLAVKNVWPKFNSSLYFECVGRPKLDGFCSILYIENNMLTITSTKDGSLAISAQFICFNASNNEFEGDVILIRADSSTLHPCLTVAITNRLILGLKIVSCKDISCM